MKSVCCVTLLGALLALNLLCGVSAQVNLALGRSASQISTGNWCNGNQACLASYAVDGNLQQNPGAAPGCAHTDGTANQWWRVELDAATAVSSIVIYMRSDCCAERVPGVGIYLTHATTGGASGADLVGTLPAASASNVYIVNVPAAFKSTPYEFVELRQNGQAFALCEVEVFGSPVTNVAIGKTATQQSTANICGDHNYPCSPIYAIDGNIAQTATGVNNYCAVLGGANQWWRVDLGQSYDITGLQLMLRTDVDMGNAGAKVYLSNSATAPDTNAQAVLTMPLASTTWQMSAGPDQGKHWVARYLEVRSSTTGTLAVCELLVAGTNVTSPCATQTCNNHGTCSPAFDGSATCACSTGYTGASCETFIDLCVGVQCGNGTCALGVCHCTGGYTMGQGSTQCLIPPSFGTPSCTAGFDKLDNSDLSGFDLASSWSQTTFEDCLNFCQATEFCYAVEFHNGDHGCWAKGLAAAKTAPTTSNGNTAGKCKQLPTDVCATMKCQNGGKCDVGVCHCVNGYTGAKCETAPAKTPMCTQFNSSSGFEFTTPGNAITTNNGFNTVGDCMNLCESVANCGGYSYNAQQGTCWTRTKAAAISGQTANAAVSIGFCSDPCAGLDCNTAHGGFCSLGVCHCRNGYTGANCETAPKQNPICNDWTITKDADYYGNDLATGYGLTQFEDCLNFCQSTPNCYAVEWWPTGTCFAKGFAALQGGTTQSVGNTAGGCKGSQSDPCTAGTMKCQNGGTCEFGVCHCVGGYLGSTCNEAPAQTPACASFTSQDNTEFTTIGSNVIRTQNGVVRASDCANWCQNTAACYAWAWNGQSCQMLPVAYVTATTKASANKHSVGVCTNPCNGVQCQNGGSCDLFGGALICHCRNGYTGDRCQTPPPVGAPSCKNGVFIRSNNSDYYGNDLATVNNVATFDDCLNACYATLQCYAVEYWPSGTCYIKGAAALAAGTSVSTGNIAGGCAQPPANPCDNVKCQHGGACKDGACHCTGGYTGTKCETAPLQVPACTDFVFVNNTDFANTDNTIRTQGGVLTAGDCSNWCMNAANCFGWTWNGQQCTLKTVAAMTTATKAAQGIAIATCSPASSCVGIDCGAHGTCGLGTCHCTGGYTGAQCTTAPTSPPSCLNGVFNMKNNTDYYGSDLSTGYGVLTYDDCLNYCLTVPNCYAFEYAPSSHTCFAKALAALSNPIVANGNMAGACASPPQDPCKTSPPTMTCANGGVCEAGLCHCKGGYTGSTCGTKPAQDPKCDSFTTVTNVQFATGDTIATTAGIMRADDCANLCQASATCYGWQWNGQQCMTKVLAAIQGATSALQGTTIGVCTTPCKGVTCGAHGSCSVGKCHCTGGYLGDQCQNAPAKTPSCSGFTQLNNTDLYGNDLSNAWGVTSYDDCLNYCQSVPACYAFEWLVGQSACYAKGYAALDKKSVSNGNIAGGCTNPPADPCTTGEMKCDNNGVCDKGICHCKGGYSGATCQNKPAQTPKCSQFNTVANTDFANTDNTITNNACLSADDCSNWCQNAANCYAWMWNGQQCYTKPLSALTTATKTAQGVTIGLCATPCQGVDCGQHGTCSFGTCHCNGGYLGDKCQNAPAKAPSCNAFTQYNNSDLYGSDLGTQYGMQTYADCLNYCQSVPNCYAFEWWNSGACFLKGANALESAPTVSMGNIAGGCTTKPQDPCTTSPPGVVCNNGGKCSKGLCHCTGGYTGVNCDTKPAQTPKCSLFSTVANTDFTTTDNTINTQGGVASADDCANWCMAAANCYAWTWNGQQCSTKTLAGMTMQTKVAQGITIGLCSTPCQGVDCGTHGTCGLGSCHCRGGYTGAQCQTAPKQPPSCNEFKQFNNSDFYGNDLGTGYGVNTYDDCVNYCQTIPNCYAFEWWPTGTCFAKGAAALEGGNSPSAGNIAGGCTTKPQDPCVSAKIQCQNGGSCSLGVCHCNNGYTGMNCETKPAQTPKCTQFSIVADTDFVNTDNTITTQAGVLSATDCSNWCMNAANCYGFMWNGQQCFTKPLAAMTTGTKAAKGSSIGLCATPCQGVTCGDHGTCGLGSCHCNGGYTGNQCQTKPPAGAPSCTSFNRFNNSDLFGNDLTPFYGVATFDDCLNLCQSVPNCYAVEYQSGGSCFTKGAAAIGKLSVSNGNTAASCTTTPSNVCDNIKCQNGGSCAMGVCHCTGGFTGTNCQTKPAQTPACDRFKPFVNNSDWTGTQINTYIGFTDAADCANWCQSQLNCWAFTFTGSQCIAYQMNALSKPTPHNGYTAGACDADPCKGVQCGQGHCEFGSCKCDAGWGPLGTGANRCSQQNKNFCANFTKLENIDFYGNDLPQNGQATVSSLDDCISTCQATADCNVVSYIGTTCYMKFGSAYATKNPQGGSQGAACTALINGGAKCDPSCTGDHTRCILGVCSCTDGFTPAQGKKAPDCSVAPPATACLGSYTNYTNVDLFIGQVAQDGGFDLSVCVDKCKARGDCKAVTLDRNGLCHFRNISSLALVSANPMPVAIGALTAVCDAATAASASLCNGITCQHGGSCSEGVCQCVGGYSGVNCQTPQPAGYCSTFSSKSDVTVQNAVAMDPTAGYDAVSLEVCVGRCQAAAGCLIVSYTNYTCRLFRTGANPIARPPQVGTTVSACFSVFADGGKARFTAKYAGVNDSSVAPTLKTVLAAAGLNDQGNVIMSVTPVASPAPAAHAVQLLATSGSMAVEVVCQDAKGCSAGFTSLKNTVQSTNGAVATGITITAFQMWCSNFQVPAYADDCTVPDPNGGSASSSSLSGGAIAGIVIGVIAFVAIAIFIFFYLRLSGAPSSAKSGRRSHRTGSGSTARGTTGAMANRVELNTVSSTPVQSSTPGASLYSTLAAPQTATPGAQPVPPPLPPMPRM